MSMSPDEREAFESWCRDLRPVWAVNAARRVLAEPMPDGRSLHQMGQIEAMCLILYERGCDDEELFGDAQTVLAYLHNAWGDFFPNRTRPASGGRTRLIRYVLRDGYDLAERVVAKYGDKVDRQFWDEHPWLEEGAR